MEGNKEIENFVKREFRREIAGKSLLGKIISLAYPILWVSESFVGPDSKTICNYGGTERINITKNEAFVRVNAYWNPLCGRRYDYTLRKEGNSWKVEDKNLTGMS